jgi:hypothetical protein
VRKRKWDNYSSGEELFGLAVTRFPELEQTQKEVGRRASCRPPRLQALLIWFLSQIAPCTCLFSCDGPCIWVFTN